MNITERTAAVQSEIESFVKQYSYEYVTLEARLVDEGDMLSGTTKGAGETVVSTKNTGAKAHLTVQGKKTPIAFGLQEEVTVGRHIETEASKAAREELRTELRALRHLCYGAEEDTANQQKLTEYLEQGWYERVAEYAAAIAANQPVRGLYIHTVEALEAGRFQTAVEAVGKLTEELTSQCLSGNDTPTWSGGFTVKNAVIQETGELRRKAIQNAGRGW